MSPNPPRVGLPSGDRSTVLDRSVVLAGDEAAGWLRGGGWRAAEPAGLRIRGDRLAGDGFSLARFWTTGGRFTGSPGVDGCPTVLLPLDGGGALRWGDRRVELPPGSLAVIGAAGGVELEAVAGGTYLQITLAGALGIADPGPFTAAEADVDHRHVLVGLSNAILGSALDDVEVVRAAVGALLAPLLRASL